MRGISIPRVENAIPPVEYRENSYDSTSGINNSTRGIIDSTGGIDNYFESQQNYRFPPVEWHFH